ncbi:MAG: histidine kinase [Treponema sp.]|nr:histidine kinase [Treponema sp.]
MIKNANLQFKIAFTVTAYIVGIGITGNLFLFFYLQEAVSRKSEQLNRAYIQTVCFQLDRNFDNVFSLAALCATEPAVLQLISRDYRQEREIIIDSLGVQDQMNAFLRASPINSYIDKLILFNSQDIFVQAQGRQVGAPADLDNIRQLSIYTRFIADNLPWVSGFGQSISTVRSQDAYQLLFRVYGSFQYSTEAFIYLETGIDMITASLREYPYHADRGKIFAFIPASGEVILHDSPHLTIPQEGGMVFIPPDTDSSFRFREGRRNFRLDRIPLENENLILYNQTDVTSFAFDDQRILYTVLGTVLLSLLAAAGMTLVLSVFLTRPIYALIGRIRKISVEKDFSHDPEIEKRGDEIGLIGKALNEMSADIANYLIKIQEHYQQQKSTEIALLQTQINPHFLYNTLDSIQWMAKIQNNNAIADIIKRLINLLQGIAGQTGVITLAEELLVLEDYTELMSLRYMGSFRIVNTIPEDFLDCRIPLLTLQPFVENAILHGIIPSGRFGTITLSTAGEGEFLNIIVHDTGVGIDPELLANIKTKSGKKRQGNPSLNHIGIANVEERLKMYFGESCGISFTSRPGEYTEAVIRIKMER